MAENRKKYRDTKEHRKLTKNIESEKRAVAKFEGKKNEHKSEMKANKKLGIKPKVLALLKAEKSAGGKHPSRKVYN